MAVIKELGNMKKLKFPKADCAVLFSTDSHASIPYGRESNEVESAYTFLGPIAGSYFTFVDDYGVEAKPKELAQYKALYVPFGKYMRKEVADNLIDYVKNGGTLISGDPEIFSFCSDGTSLKYLSKKLFGATVTPGKKESYIEYGKLALPIYSKSYNIKLYNRKNIKILARYKDGKPAIIEHKYGKGKALLFAANPFQTKALSNNNWRKFFTVLQQKYAMKTGHAYLAFSIPKKTYPKNCRYT